MDKKIILFELNEVPLRIIDQFCRWFPSSTLARRLGECFQYETYTEDVSNLSPWITWPSLHRGVSDERHLIANFGQNLVEVDSEFPPAWKLLARHGVRTGVCGSLHSYPLPKDLNHYAFYLPDTFAAGSECFPNELAIFQDFNLRMARESGRNVSSKVPWQSALRLLASSSELGFRLRTFMDVGKQLVSERLRSWQKTRRRTYQTVLAFDVFMKQLDKSRPDFATFFTNHVASSMHRYWAAAFPDDYEQFGFDQKWVDTFGSEIKFTMGKFDEFLTRLLRFVDANPQYNLWIATSMGQAATTALPIETQLYVTDLARFMTALGLERSDWESRPAMLPRVSVVVRSDKAAAFEQALRGLAIDGSPLTFHQSNGGFFNLVFGHSNLHLGPETVSFGSCQVPFAELGLGSVEIDDKSGSSAYHIPQGALLVYDPLDRSQKPGRTQISTLEILPTILRNFAVPVPDYMRRAASLARAA